MPPSLSPKESDILRDLYLAGAHSEALARAFGRDPRAVRAALRRAGIALRREPPLPTAWQATLSLPARRGLQRYLQQLEDTLRAAWERLHQVALAATTDTYVFAERADYDAVLDTVRPAEALPALARRLGLDLTVVLLAYADWADEHCGV